MVWRRPTSVGMRETPVRVAKVGAQPATPAYLNTTTCYDIFAIYNVFTISENETQGRMLGKKHRYHFYRQGEVNAGKRDTVIK
jgi:hypothetical protein